MVGCQGPQNVYLEIPADFTGVIEIRAVQSARPVEPGKSAYRVVPKQPIEVMSLSFISESVQIVAREPDGTILATKGRDQVNGPRAMFGPVIVETSAFYYVGEGVDARPALEKLVEQDEDADESRKAFGSL